MTLSEVIQHLHASNVSCGLQTQLGGSIHVWVGDDLRGITIREFSAGDVDQIGQWLETTSRLRYPHSCQGTFKIAQVPALQGIG